MVSNIDFFNRFSRCNLLGLSKLRAFFSTAAVFWVSISAASPEMALSIGLDTSETTTPLTYLSWDTEGTGRENQNLLRSNDGVSLELETDNAFTQLALTPGSDSVSTSGSATWTRRFESLQNPGLSFEISQNQADMTLGIFYNDTSSTQLQSLVINIPFDPTVTPTTVIPSAWEDESNVMLLPAIISAPDFGQMLLSSSVKGVTADLPGSRSRKRTDLRITIPPLSAGSSVKLSMTPVRLDAPSGVNPELWKLARRGWFNIFQPSSNWTHDERPISAPLGMLSNNVISDPVSFVMWMYSDHAFWQPELAPGVSIMPSIRRTMEWWMDEKTSTTGETIGYWHYYNFLDSNPSLIITAWNYVEVTSDTEWLKGRIEQLESLSSFIESRNIDHDGLVEAVQSGNRNTLIDPDRSCCWWDAINCGHKDGYTNALIYRAWRCLADLEKTLGRPEQQAKYTRLADRLKEAYAKVLMNPKTGWLGWWRSEDKELHDYATTVVNAMAIEYGLIDPEQGKVILSRLRNEMDRAGFTNFHLGVPCFLTPVNRSDYLQPAGLGCPKQEDGKDTFGQYMNGGVNASHVLHFLNAHYVVGDPEPADKILHEMLKHLNAGRFQRGVTDAIHTGIDWTDWEGNPTGYEGFLSDSFRFVQAVLVRNEEYRARIYRPLNQ